MLLSDSSLLASFFFCTAYVHDDGNHSNVDICADLLNVFRVSEWRSTQHTKKRAAQFICK